MRGPRGSVRPGHHGGATGRHHVLGGRLRGGRHRLPGAGGVLQGPHPPDGHLQCAELHHAPDGAGPGGPAQPAPHHHPHPRPRRGAAGIRHLRQEGRGRHQGDAQALGDEQGLDDLGEAGLVGGPGDARHHLALLVDHHRVGRALEAEAGADARPRIERGRIRLLVAPAPGARLGGGVVDVDADELHVARSVLLREPLDPRRLRGAHLAPRGLEAQHHHLLADERAGVHRLAVIEQLGGERGGGRRRGGGGGHAQDEGQRGTGAEKPCSSHHAIQYNPRMSELEHALRRAVEGDVRFDSYSRLLYSTDASMYQVEPMGVVIPRHADDVQAVLEVANRLGAPLLARGGGTSLTGQTVNHAVVLDFSRYMNGVLEVNTEELWARVQPGLVQDELNHHVRGMGLLFGPDTSTSNRATLGGMMGNNSGGSHSLAYGLTVEHVIEIRALLVDGSEVVFGELSPAEFEAKTRAPGLEGQIYREVAAIRESYADEIRARYPKHWRRVAGYNLNELLGIAIRPHSYAGGGNGKPRPLSMARLVVGSEGTLLTILEAKVRLVKRPKATAVD